ncbi:MAG: NAD(P)-binding domain-containing protein, partial [Acidimicrobiales bacterium]
MKLCVIGGGRMGAALVAGLLESGWVAPDEVSIAELYEPRRDE